MGLLRTELDANGESVYNIALRRLFKTSRECLRSPLVEIHAHAGAAECDAFALETKALFDTLIAGERDAATRSDDAVPGQASRGAQRPDGLAGGAGEAGFFRDLTVGCDFAFRNTRNHGLH